jgi:hypothetical protein
VIVRGLAERHIEKSLARELYEDVTPPLSPEEVEARRMSRLMGPFARPGGTGAPDKRDRRALRRLKRGD